VFLREQGSDVRVAIDPSASPQAAGELAGSEPAVLNDGTVDAPGGRIVLAAGDIYSHAISNVGSLSASVKTGDAGDVRLAAGAGRISNTGSIEARSDTAKGGSVSVKATEVINSGTVDVTGPEGGQVAMEGGARLGQFGQIHADGTATDGGGVRLEAGDVVVIGTGSLTTADAGKNGDGGEVTVSSPDTALFWPDARIEAKGGTESGDGGFVDVSGENHVEIWGEVNASATRGAPGTFKVDPAEITIVNDLSSVPDLTDPDVGDPRVFVPTAQITRFWILLLSDYWQEPNVTLDTTAASTGWQHVSPPSTLLQVQVTAPGIRGSTESPLRRNSVTLTLNAANDIIMTKGGSIGHQDAGL
jgi:hypothetical protein